VLEFISRESIIILEKKPIKGGRPDKESSRIVTVVFIKILFLKVIRLKL